MKSGKIYRNHKSVLQLCIYHVLNDKIVNLLLKKGIAYSLNMQQRYLMY